MLAKCTKSFTAFSIAGQVEPGRTPLNAGQHELLDRIEADRAELHRLHDTGGHDRLLEYLQQPQDLDELLLAAIAHAALEQPPDALEPLGQVPALQRSCLVQRTGLLLQQRQVMLGIEDELIAAVDPLVTGDDL